ncbi:hypothetical protein TSUD_347590 [Trifolium subterraneum]|nr:hypothetical protein TSUD_347590 [Trifolium subterraneum]
MYIYPSSIDPPPSSKQRQQSKNFCFDRETDRPRFSFNDNWMACVTEKVDKTFLSPMIGEIMRACWQGHETKAIMAPVGPSRSHRPSNRR